VIKLFDIGIGYAFKRAFTPLPFLPNQPPGVNFINILQAAFTQADPKSAKRY